MKRSIIVSIMCTIGLSLTAQAPKMTVIIVVDQLAAHFIPQLKPHLTGGIKFLSEQGTSYVNAFYDHSVPGTGPGHALLTTGTYGSFHGIVNNSWFSPDGKKVSCDEGTQEAAVFAPDGKLYPFGKSPKNLLVENLSDQMMLHSYPHARNTVWTISLKSRAAIMTAGRLGKALWFDSKSGNFTSSKAYFDTLPDWVNRFNKEHAVASKPTVTWTPFFQNPTTQYSFPFVNDYTYSMFGQTIIGRPLPLRLGDGHEQFYVKTPDANQLLINLAQECIHQNYTGKENDRFILWLSLSGLDKIGHIVGPDSKETLDMIYHVDSQLKTFIDSIYEQVPPEDVLFILTSDHGTQSIPEIAQKRGLTLARRYHYKQIIENINRLIEKSYGVSNIIQNFKEPQFYLNQATIATLSNSVKKSIFTDIKNYMLSLPGIRRAWTFNELQNESFEHYDSDRYLQRQLHRGRSGQIIYSVNPYTTISTYYPDGVKGTTHITQYAYDRHVPLIFYQKDRFTKKRVVTNVFMPQVSVSLATLFEVPRPSAATADVLPELPL